VVFASVFMVVIIAVLVMVSRAQTFGKKLAREWQEQDSFQPSQQLLDIMLAMSPGEKVALFPTLSVALAGAPSVTSELTQAERSAPDRISA
jgi:L-asparagine transporter-like permease